MLQGTVLCVFVLFMFCACNILTDDLAHTALATRVSLDFFLLVLAIQGQLFEDLSVPRFTAIFFLSR